MYPVCIKWLNWRQPSVSLLDFGGSSPQSSIVPTQAFKVSSICAVLCWVCVTWGGFNWWKHSSSPPPVLLQSSPSPAHMETPWYTLLTTLTLLSRGCILLCCSFCTGGRGRVQLTTFKSSTPHETCGYTFVNCWLQVDIALVSLWGWDAALSVHEGQVSDAAPALLRTQLPSLATIIIMASWLLLTILLALVTRFTPHSHRLMILNVAERWWLCVCEMLIWRNFWR